MSRMRGPALALCLAALVLTGCSKEEETLPPPGTADLCNGAVGSGPKVGLAYDVGGRNDLGTNDAAFAGLSKAVKDLQATCIEGEAAEGELEAARVDRLRNFIDNGATTVIAAGALYAPTVDKLARKYPRVHFAVIDTTPGDEVLPRNVTHLNFAVEQASFLAGVAAALKSTSHTVGFIAAPRDPSVEPAGPYEAGFTAGAKAADPKVKVLTAHLELDGTTPGKPPTTKEVVSGQFDEGADVVFGSSGVAQRTLVKAAADAGEGHWAIGVNSDQYLTAVDDLKPFVLTSVLKRFDTVTYDYIASVDQGRPLTGVRTYGLQQHGVAYARSGHFVDTYAGKLASFRRRIVTGDLIVPTSVRKAQQPVG